jgi:hypothetical protein
MHVQRWATGQECDRLGRGRGLSNIGKLARNDQSNDQIIADGEIESGAKGSRKPLVESSIDIRP